MEKAVKSQLNKLLPILLPIPKNPVFSTGLGFENWVRVPYGSPLIYPTKCSSFVGFFLFLFTSSSSTTLAKVIPSTEISPPFYFPYKNIIYGVDNIKFV